MNRPAHKTLADYLEQQDFDRCLDLLANCPSWQLIDKLHDEVILPNLDRIEKKAGVRVDPLQLCYLIEYVMETAVQRIHEGARIN